MSGRQQKCEGYLLVDHRSSPGMPELASRRLGLDPRFTGEGKMYESVTLSCAHCRTVVVKNPLRVRERGHCFKCNAYVCDACAAVRECRPFTQVIDDVLDGKTPIPLLAKNMKKEQVHG
jgi:hypothetical protein